MPQIPTNALQVYRSFVLKSRAAPADHHYAHVEKWVRFREHLPPPPAPRDPIFSALERYRAAVAELDNYDARDHVAEECATEAMQRAHDALECTMPTTLAGMEALLGHVQKLPDHHDLEHMIGLLLRATRRMLRKNR